MNIRKLQIPRIITPHTYIRGKEYLSDDRLPDLLEDCYVEEKLDGRTLEIVVQAGRQIYPTKSYVLYGEFLKTTHTTMYRNLPNDVMFFDVYDVDGGRFLGEKEKVLFS